jgi:hypothetical protein
MKGISQSRFADDAAALAQWQSASNVVGPPRTGGQTDKRTAGQTGSPETPPQGGDIRPAA